MDDPLSWAFFAAVGGIAAFVYALRRSRVARLIDELPTSRVRSAAQGYVEIGGIAVLFANSLNPAPLTRRSCVWWYYKIEERRESRGKRRWETLHSATSDETFLLQDEDKSCVVDPEGAEVHPAERQVWYGSNEWPAQILGTHSRIGALFHRYRYTEYRIPDSCTLGAIGEFRSLGRIENASIEDEVVVLLRRWKQDQAGLLRRFDTNRDGVLSVAEWERARTAARAQILSEQTRDSATPGVHLLARPRDGRPFLLAALGLTRIARKARWQAAAGFAAFIACAGVVAWGLAQ